MQAGPETLMMAMAARPGAVERANMVDSSLVKVASVLFEIMNFQGERTEGLIFFSGHECLKAVDIHRGRYAESHRYLVFPRAVNVILPRCKKPS